MSWDKLFGEELPEQEKKPSRNTNNDQSSPGGGGVFGAPPPGNEKFFQGARPQRFEDLPERAEPAAPDLGAAEPWFVGPEPKQRTIEPKKVVKRTAGVLFPIIGLTLIVAIIAGAILMVINIYG